MSTAIFRNKLSTFKRKGKGISFMSNRRGRVMITRIVHRMDPDDELLMEFINSTSFDNLYRNEVFKEALDKRLTCLESKHHD